MREQWFCDNIIAGIGRNFAFYFGYRNLILYVLFILVFNILNILIIKYFFKKADYAFVAAESYVFDGGKKSDKSALVVLIISFCLYVVNIFSLDGTVFNAYDTMNISNIQNMRYGVKPVFDSVRFTPAGSIDHNVVYAITSNYRLIDCWNIIKQALVLFLLYRFFAFVPVAKRLVMLAVINFIPAVFWINNIIFSEQNTLIFVLCSFLCLIKYDHGKNPVMLFAFIIWSNLAFYTKESNILLYMGLLAFLVLRRVFNEEIVLKSFLSPFKTLSAMPVEYLLFCNMFIFSIFYLLSSDLLTDGAYLRHNHRDIAELMQINRIVLVLNAAALAVSARNLCKPGDNLLKAAVLGCTLISFFIVFYLQIAGYPDYYKTWYLYLPAVFCTGYLFCRLEKKMLFCLFVPVMLFSAYENYVFFEREEGKCRHGLADYVISRKEGISSWFVAEKNSRDSWKLECFNAALRYTHPNGVLVFKTDHYFRPIMEEENSFFFKTVRASHPEAGDYIIVHKSDNPHFSDKNMLFMYENECYLVYRHK